MKAGRQKAAWVEGTDEVVDLFEQSLKQKWQKKKLPVKTCKNLVAISTFVFHLCSGHHFVKLRPVKRPRLEAA